VAAGLSATSILATITLLPARPKVVSVPGAEKTSHAPRKVKDVFAFAQIIRFFKMPTVRPLLLQFFMFAFAFTLFVTGLALFCAARFSWHGKPFAAQQVGFIFTYSGAINLIVQMLLMRWLAKKFGEKRLVIGGFLLMSFGYGALSGAMVVPVLLLFLTFNNLGAAILRPALQSTISQKVERTHQGAVMGVIQSMQSIAQILAPLVSGALIDRGWLVGWALSCSSVAAIGLIFSFRNR
jgi:MFS family permease